MKLNFIADRAKNKKLSLSKAAARTKRLFLTKIAAAFCGALACAALFSCQKVPEMTLEEIAEAREKSSREFFTATKSKPYKGQDFVPGQVGGVWNDVCMSDPKTFNILVAERDGQSAGIMGQTTDWLFDYDYEKREWIPRCAYFMIESDQASDTLTVHVTLRDGLYWSFVNSDKKIPVTSDDIVWWYDEVSGDERFQSSAYSGQFVTMADGESRRIKAVKIDDKNFDFVFPRIVADPLLATNDSFKPSWIYKKAKEDGGVEGVKNLFGIDSDVQTIPSMGMWFIESYSPGQRLVFARNADYWQKDSAGNAIPYPQKMVMQIVGDQNTSYLLFTQGKLETYSPTPENLDDVIRGQEGGYTVFNADGSVGAQLWSFNQNPKNRAEPFYDWFCKKEFRQAMSSLLNRDRIIAQTYRGLAYPKYDFFPDGNPFYNPDIQLEYKFDLKKAEALLNKIGFERGADGRMLDHKKRPVEFDLAIASSANTSNDIAQIISDEAKKLGIKVNVRQTDFQKMVESLTATFDWQSIIIGLGANLFPSQGSNVWPSSGNLHLWHPYQQKPATAWEARCDFLYNEGSYTADKLAAQKIWDEYQRLILEECPIIYLVRPASFYAIRNRWNLSNFYYDNLNGAKTDWVWLAE